MNIDNVMVSDRYCDFLSCNRSPHFQPIISSSPMDQSDTLHRLHRLVVFPRVRHVPRQFNCRGPSGERTLLRDLWLLVLDSICILDREIYLGISLHVRLSRILLHPLFTCVPSTTRQHHPLGGIQNLLPTTTQSQGRQNEYWNVHNVI